MNSCPNCDHALDLIEWNKKIDGRYALYCKNCGYCFPFHENEIKEIVFNEGIELWIKYT